LQTDDVHRSLRPMVSSPTKKNAIDGKTHSSDKDAVTIGLGLDVVLEVACTDKLMSELKRSRGEESEKQSDLVSYVRLGLGSIPSFAYELTTGHGFTSSGLLR
jgi:hypothetical protein